MSLRAAFMSKGWRRSVEGLDGADARTRRELATAAIALAVAMMTLAPAVMATDRHDERRWVGTWSASPQLVAAPIQINGQTVRQIVHTSVGGAHVRVRFSNATQSNASSIPTIRAACLASAALR